MSQATIQAFKTFDGLDNRRELMSLLARLGHGLTEDQAAARRVAVLQRLLRAKAHPMAGQGVVGKLSVAESYFGAVAIGNALGGDIEAITAAIEAEVKRDGR